MKRNQARFSAAAASGMVLLIISQSQAAPPLSVGEEQAQIQANQATVSESQFQKQLEQFQLNTRLAANPDVPIGERVLVDYGAFYSFNYLSADDPAQNTHILRDSEVGVYGMLNLDNVQTVFVRGHLSYRDYGRGDAFPGGIEQRGEHSAVDQAYYQFDLQHYLAAYKSESIHDDALVRLGRQTVAWGNSVAFNQNIDGGVADIIKGPLTVEGVAGITVPDTIDFDTSRPGFDDRTERGFFGLMASYQIEQNKPFIYFLSQRDFNNEEPLITTGNAGAIETNFSYNSFYIGTGSTGSLNDHLLYGLELVAEGGNDLSNSFVLNGTTADGIVQTRDPIRAFASDARLDYVFSDPHNTRISGEIIASTGDPDRMSTNATFGGNAPHTVDRAFNGFGLLNTGVAFAPLASNIVATRLGISSQPLNHITMFRKLEVGSDIFVFNKWRSHAPIDEPSTNGSYLGWEADLFMNWQITSDVSFALRYGSFFPGETISKLESDRSRQLLFTGVTIAF
jgi:hypothetical protein